VRSDRWTLSTPCSSRVDSYTAALSASSKFSFYYDEQYHWNRGSSNLTKTLNTEQWQALTALYRILLYEAPNFLMATQHPSGMHAIRGLATEYYMRARMWCHGIHSFLEVLRHQRPESQEYMLAFIYLACQMMALLYETVAAFTDT